MPSSNRPCDAWSSETAWRASTAGWRKASQSTSDPTRSRAVWAASHAVVTIASYIGWSSAIGGARWSMPVMPTKPAASAARARATSCSKDSRICGRKRLNSIRDIVPAPGTRVGDPSGAAVVAV